MDFSLKNSIFISKKSGKLIKMQQFNQIFNFLFFVPNFLQKIKKFIKSKKQKFFVFADNHNRHYTFIKSLIKSLLKSTFINIQSYYVRLFGKLQIYTFMISLECPKVYVYQALYGNQAHKSTYILYLYLLTQYLVM